MASGLESIALAVAHLERVRSSNEGNERSMSVDRAVDVSAFSRTKSPSPTVGKQVLSKMESNASFDKASPRRTSVASPSQFSYHHGYYPSGMSLGVNTPRVVSIDNQSVVDVGGRGSEVRMYAENTSHRLTPRHLPHHDISLNSPQGIASMYQQQFHQHVLHQNAAANHSFHHDILYRMPHPPQPHGTQTFPMVQMPLLHQHLSQPSATHHCSQHSLPHRPSQPTIKQDESPDVSLSLKPDVETTHNQAQNQRAVASPSPVSVLPSAVRAFADSLEEFLSMELDHSAYPPVPKSSDVIVQVQRNDVLLGRGGETNHHTGNIQYRQLVKLCQPAYLDAKRRDKPKIAERIVHVVRCLSGRFLKKDPETSTWRDVGNVRAREKTSQALREGAPELRNGLPVGSFEEVSMSPPDLDSPKRSYSQMTSTQDYPPPKYSMVSMNRSSSETVYDHQCALMHNSSGYPGIGTVIGRSAAVTVEASPDASPLKKSRIIEENTSENSGKDQQSKEISDVSTSASVAATVSGDDEENSLQSPVSKQIPTSSSQNSCSKEMRGLPRLKLLKKRFEQCD